MSKDDPHKLTPEEALSLVEVFEEFGRDRTHSLSGTGFGMFGCNMDMTSVEAYIKKEGEARIAGPNMNAMGHGIAFFKQGEGYIFIQTNKEKLDALIKERGIEL
jgi:hypothetical protein